MYFNDYQAEPIVPKAVEGRYQVKINDIQPGNMKDGTPFTRVDLIINAQGYPHVSLFLTSGANFNAHFTAFCDTFGIPRGNSNFESWKGKKGWLDISIVEKDGYRNMRTSYILDENGYVKRSADSVQSVPQTPPQEVVAKAFDGQIMQYGEDIPF